MRDPLRRLAKGLGIRKGEPARMVRIAVKKARQARARR